MLAARAVKAAHLDDELVANEHYTVFAPPVDCFAVSRATRRAVFDLIISLHALHRALQALL